MRTRTVRPASRLLFPLLASLLLVGSGGCRPHTRPSSRQLSPATAQVISSWEKPLHVSADVPLAVMQQRYSAVTDHAQFVLNSRKPYQEVEIPLVIRDYHAYVQVKWSGRQMVCLLDTEATSILWPQWLHLDSHQLDFGAQNIGQEGPAVRGEWVLSPRISIGNLDLINVPTMAMGVPRPPTSAANSAPASSSLSYALKQPILGIFAFLPGVMTIDYAHKRLTLRNKDYDLARQPHRAHTLLLPYEKTQSGRIVLTGMLGGHKARFLLDTGEGWAAVSAAFAHDHFAALPIRKSQTSPVSSVKPSPFIGPLTVNIGGMKYRALDLYVADHVGEADVYLGAALFRACRVTIDPFRKVVLLESNR